MRGSLAKRMRQHVRKDYPFLHVAPLYTRNKVTGQIVLAKQCQRGLVQHMKREYKRRKSNGEIV